MFLYYILNKCFKNKIFIIIINGCGNYEEKEAGGACLLVVS